MCRFIVLFLIVFEEYCIFSEVYGNVRKSTSFFFFFAVRGLKLLF